MHSANKMEKAAAPILFKAQLKRPTQFINCYAMCDELGWYFLLGFHCHTLMFL